MNKNKLTLRIYIRTKDVFKNKNYLNNLEIAAENKI